MSLQTDLARRQPTAIWLNLEDLTVMSVALNGIPTPRDGRHRRRLNRVKTKVGRAYNRRRRAMARARR